MLNNGNNKCEFSAEIVAYIYDETGQRERTEFETHLANCAVCTDEFAGVSNARFSVFEWRREEFAHLSTPKIVIPYPARHPEGESMGFLSGFRQLLTLSGWRSAVAVAAVLAVFIGFGSVAMIYLSDDTRIAANVGGPSVIADEKTVDRSQSLNTSGSPTIVLPGASVVTINNSVQSPSPRPIRVIDNRNPRIAKQMTAESKKTLDERKLDRNAPVLSSYDDSDDRSLRLTDLFDDGGRKL
ncbi:MAG: zf-HC2 domain-containing protein [Pyrinomonadaceae bacterium]